MSLLNENNQPAPEADNNLAQALAAFDTPVPEVSATNLTKQALATDAAAEAEELPTAQEEATTEDEAADDEEASPFAVEFEEAFGMKPTEAVELVQELQGFRQELSLMREWGVNPGEFDTRMQQVKEFYGTLPETEREQFNSVEGAKVIWQHLQKNAPQIQQTRTARTRNTTRPAPAAAKVDFIRKADILKMDEATYQANLPAITKAYREGRVLE